MDFRNIKVEPVKPLVGAVVHADKSTLFQPGFAEYALRLLAKHGALVYPKIGLTDQEQLAFTDSIGNRLNFASTVPGGDVAAKDVYTITLDKNVNSEPEYVLGSFYWHTDGACSDIPCSPVTLLSCKRKAEEGGHTEFSNCYAAWEALPPEEKAKLEGLRVVHSVAAAVREIKMPYELSPARREMKHEHPLVMTHKDGRKSLYIGCTADYIVGMDRHQGRVILNRLLEWASYPQFVCRHTWSVGDFAMWDNIGMLHRATPYSADSGRRMHRTSVGALAA